MGQARQGQPGTIGGRGAGGKGEAGRIRDLMLDLHPAGQGALEGPAVECLLRLGDLRQDGVAFAELPLAQQENYWERAKALERGEAT